MDYCIMFFFFFSSRRRHTRYWRDWSSDVCSSDLHPVLAGKPLEELIGEQRDVLFAVPQRRDHDRHHVQPEKEILPEFFALDAFLQVAVRGGNDAHVHFHRAVAAHALELPLLEHPQEFRLERGGNLTDLVEQNRAAVREFEAPFPLVQRPGEGALLVAEKFTLDQVFRDGRAVDLDERSVGPRALAVKSA